MWMFPFIIIIIVLVVVFSVFGRGSRGPWNDFNEPSNHVKRRSALEILKERYAKGEITKEEFEQMKRDILD